MIVNIEQLKEKYNNYSNVLAKINREVKKGALFIFFQLFLLIEHKKKIL